MAQCNIHSSDDKISDAILIDSRECIQDRKYSHVHSLLYFEYVHTYFMHSIDNIFQGVNEQYNNDRRLV